MLRTSGDNSSCFIIFFVVFVFFSPFPRDVAAGASEGSGALAEGCEAAASCSPSLPVLKKHKTKHM